MFHEARRSLNPQDELARLIRERIEKRTYCMIFESQLERCWPAEKVKNAVRKAREKAIRAFAKANGWTAEIHDPGLYVILKNITLMTVRLCELALMLVRFGQVARGIATLQPCYVATERNLLMRISSIVGPGQSSE
jgi:hypothetical protein